VDNSARFRGVQAIPQPLCTKGDGFVKVAATEWLASLAAWPEEGFGLARMDALLERLGRPERQLDAVHVVGTKGKSTAARRIAATIGGLAYTSPHVSGWHERLQTDPDGFERAVERVRSAAEAVGATQFETLTAAAFTDFVARGVTAVAIEAGLGGRLDATNVLDARVVLLTNVGLEHTEVLGETREQIAAEKLAVAGPRATVVLPDGEFVELVPGRTVRIGGAREAAAAFLGRDVALAHASLPGRLEIRGNEVRDGAHTPEAVEWLLERLPRPHDYVVVASVLADKDVDGILERLRLAGSAFVATTSTNPRALPASALAARARPWFETVETVEDPAAALAAARRLGPRVLATGSLYLLADLSRDE
jgi:dihydrofolate synthase / folylpolyglutamate synthase